MDWLAWLLLPIDPSRAHLVAWDVSWHGRIMVAAWGLLAPAVLIVTRFLKVLPRQQWPLQRDSRVWWRTHWIANSLIFGATVLAVALVAWGPGGGWGWHAVLGYALLSMAVAQVGFGALRGSKGGPTDRRLRGDHFDMTPRRLVFERVHKTLGYTALATAVAAILAGLWLANAPRWMWLALALWWSLALAVYVSLQRRGWALDTYQAIWGDDPDLPGNRRPPGWGTRRGDTHRRRR